MEKLSKIAVAMKSGRKIVVGIDLGWKKSAICFLDGEGKVVERMTIKTDAAAFEKVFGKLESLEIAIESGGHANWVRRHLAALGHTVTVGDARQIQLIAKSHSKDDKRDARFLAEILLRWRDLLHPVEPRSLESEQHRAELRGREGLVRARVKLINTVRGMAASFGIKLPAATSAAFGHVAERQIPAELSEAALPLLRSIKQLTAQIKACDKRVLKLCKARYHEQTRRLLTIPGVGPLTALTFVLELDGDVKRLRSSRAAGAMAGLRPSRRDSGESNPELGITKLGNSMLRRYLVQCAQYMLGRHGRECALQRWGLGLAGTSKRGKRRAVVATARKLAVLLHTLWRKDVDFDPMMGLESAEQAA